VRLTGTREWSDLAIDCDTVVTALQNMLPDTRTDLVEIDRAVDRVARQYFDFKPSPDTQIMRRWRRCSPPSIRRVR
jgi:hypothetical protein